jgi:hypothetical protein
MRTQFQLIATTIKDRINLRCSYCGASLLFGRHRIAAIMFDPATRSGETRRWVIRNAGLLKERASARGFEATLGVGVVLLGYLLTGMVTPEPRTATVAVALDPPKLSAPVVASTGTPEIHGGALFDPAPVRFELAVWTSKLNGQIIAAPQFDQLNLARPVDELRPHPSESQELASHAGSGAMVPSQNDGDAQEVTGSVRPLVGTWGPDERACSKASSERSGLIPMSISSGVARAGGAVCAFKDVQQNGNRWVAIAQCAAGRKRWTSRVTLVLSGRRLSWASERGSQDYLRCGRTVLAQR